MINNETFVRMAREKEQELVVWNELDESEKKEVMNNFEKYLITFN